MELSNWISLIGLLSALYIIYVDIRIRLNENIPIILIDNEHFFSKYHIYNSYVNTVGPLDLKIKNFSNANAYNLKINIQLDLKQLEKENILEKIDKNIYQSVHHFQNIILEIDNKSVFNPEETKKQQKFHNDFIIERQALAENKSTNITSQELASLNNLIDFYTAYKFADSQDEIYPSSFEIIPFKIKIEYQNLNNHKYETTYDLKLRYGFISSINTSRGIFPTEYGYQVIKISDNSMALKKRKKIYI